MSLFSCLTGCRFTTYSLSLSIYIYGKRLRVKLCAFSMKFDYVIAILGIIEVK